MESIARIYGSVDDVEELFTALDLKEGRFSGVPAGERTKLIGSLRRSICEYFKYIQKQKRAERYDQKQGGVQGYDAFARRVEPVDCILTFNYDVALENSLIGAKKFRVRNGYGASFPTKWDEPASEVTVLKLHGSINWIGHLFDGTTGYSRAAMESLGQRPYVDNKDSILAGYPAKLLDDSSLEGGLTGCEVSLVLPTHEKKYSVNTSMGDEWRAFYDGLWKEAAESLARSTRIVVIGYSMPAADRRSRALILSSPNKRAEVLLCSAGSNSTLKGAFEDHGFWRVVEVGDFSDFLGSSAPARGE